MGKRLVMSDNLFWDPNRMIMPEYSWVTDSEGNNGRVEVTGYKSIQDDFVWIDCGGFITTNSTGSQPYWEVRRNTSIICNGDSQQVGERAMNYTYQVPFNSTPSVVGCVMSGTTHGSGDSQWTYGGFNRKIAITAETSNGFRVAMTNGADKSDFVMCLWWVAVGD